MSIIELFYLTPILYFWHNNVSKLEKPTNGCWIVITQIQIANKALSTVEGRGIVKWTKRYGRVS